MKDYKSPESMSQKAEVKKLLQFKHMLGPYKTEIIFLVITLFVSTASVLGFGYAFRMMVDGGLGVGNSAVLDKWLIIIFTLILTMASAIYLRIRFLAYVGENISADLRRKAYTKFTSLSADFFDLNKSSEISSALTTDIATIQTVITGALPIFARNLLLLIGGITLLIITSPVLSGLLLVLIPLTVVPILFLGKRVRKKSKETQSKLAELSTHISESLEEIKYIQANGTSQYEQARFITKSQNVISAALAAVKVRALLTSVVVMFIFCSIGYLLHVGGGKLIEGSISAGELASFVFYAILVAGSVGALSEVMGDMQRAAGAADNLSELFSNKPSIIESDNPVKMPSDILCGIEFENVCFNYPARQEISALNEINFHIKAGQKIAFIGPSGGGKSTIFQLILRLYDPTKGIIKFGGIDTKLLSLSELRKKFFWLPQNPVIFSGSFLYNLTYCNPQASQESIKDAIEKAQCSDILSKMPNGLETELGWRGSSLSGGEKQRIAIARAFLANPEFILLDEATSSLDSENEASIQNAIFNLMKGKTALIIAHRLSTIHDVDNIYFIRNGRIEASGNHAELLIQSAQYSAMVKQQEIF